MACIFPVEPERLGTWADLEPEALEGIVEEGGGIDGLCIIGDEVQEGEGGRDLLVEDVIVHQLNVCGVVGHVGSLSRDQLISINTRQYQ